MPAIEAGRVPLRVITGEARARSRGLLWFVYTIASVAAFLALIYLRTAVDQSAFEIRRIERLIDIEIGRRNQLHLEKIRLESPQEIVPIAEGMLGMTLPEDVIPITVARQSGAGAPLSPPVPATTGDRYPDSTEGMAGSAARTIAEAG